MEKRLLKQIDLDNGQIVEIFDDSRPVAGDRWLVSVRACVRIAVDDRLAAAADPSGKGNEAVRRMVGESVIFEKQMTRNFIHGDEKDRIRDNLVASFMDSTLAYLSGATFAEKLVQKAYREALSKQWRNFTNPS